MAVNPPTDRDARNQDSRADAIDESHFDPAAETEQPADDPSENAENAEQAADLASELAAQKDRLLRLQAEMENLRNRTTREIAESHRYAPMSLIRELLPVVDNVERAIAAAEQAGESTSLLEGFKLVQQQLLGVLEKHHCKRIDDVGEPFDPQFHESIMQQPSAEQPANHVLMATQTGYMLHDRVVRPAQVIISSGPDQALATDGQKHT